MRSRLRPALALVLSVSASAQTVDVGTGAPTPAIQELFVEAWSRDAFNLLVALPPLGNVKKFGAAGYVQEFSGASTSAQLAIVYNPNLNAAFQEQAAMFAFYSGTTASTAGYPTIDTTNCPALITSQDSNNSCQYQLFDNDYALFTYAALFLLTSQTFSIADPFYTLWTSMGGVAGNNGFALGPPLTAQTAVTSSFSSKATLQTYDRGAIYNITSGTLSGRLLAVKEPIYDLYVTNGLQGGLLGLPATGELIEPNGMMEQMFEGGAIEYDPSTLVATLLSPVGSVAIQPSTSAQLNLGGTLTVTATVTSSLAVQLSDRAVIWNTTNGNVVQIASTSGLTATIKGVGGGVASITATSGGKTSAPLSVTVIAPCCQIGEGAPAALQGAFQAAVLRDKLNIALPAASPALRVGNGYVQQLQSTDATPVTYLIAVPDGSSTGCVVTGAILAAYLNRGGPSGSLGYPTADATSAGRQLFQQGALAGSPVLLVNGSILTKWAALGYEGGVSGSPTGAAASFITFRATSGSAQSFQGATILTQTTGSLAGSTFAVTGLILAQYVAAGAAAGDLGAPLSDEYTNSAGLREQDFEGGSATYAPGAAAANVVISPRVPVVTATPSSVLSGSFVHLTIGGFANNTPVQVSITGQPNFLATLAAGAYTWDVFVPPNAASGTVVVRAAQVSGSAAAQASYTIRAASSVVMTLAILSGDGQTGAPGALLAAPLTVLLKDNLGNPAPGQPVAFAASPGAQLVSASTSTDANGQASAVLRLPSSASLALVTAQAAHNVVTFSANGAASSLTNFPAISQVVSGNLGNGPDPIRAKGSLLAAAAGIILYHQLRGELASPNGLASPATLNSFLQAGDGFISLGGSTEQTVNLWRLGGFVAGNIDVSIEQTDLGTLRSLVAGGSPVLLALAIAGNQGSHFVVATGVAGDGSLLIADPDPSFGQTNLNGYLNGLATLTGAVRLLPQAPAYPSSFLIVSNAAVQLASVAGTCGTTLAFPGVAAVASLSASMPPGTLYFRPCAGTSYLYELDGSGSGFLDDLTEADTHIALPGTSAAQQIAGSPGSWTISPLQTTVFSGGIVNAASLTSDLAPGGIASIFGAGLGNAAVTVNGEAAIVLAALGFQVNLQIPADIPTGTATFIITSASGSATAQAAISSEAPEIFTISSSQAALTNQDNSLNTGSDPAFRGSSIVIYGTGFGAVGSAAGLSPIKTPLSVVIGGIRLTPAFAGLTPGAVGLYQVNVALPTALAPGLSLPLYLMQGTVASHVVNVAIQ
ncbi:MAG TPA: Ig-like domain-containing protein [Bryobacteraceae bacterium]|jgi:uncharacterized protein (TIGR03437 family)|nr:Ig-like domain-containing protein [Bryobacteraceae bacterium]